jgi:hypothetical protein
MAIVLVPIEATEACALNRRPAANDAEHDPIPPRANLSKPEDWRLAYELGGYGGI